MAISLLTQEDPKKRKASGDGLGDFLRRGLNFASQGNTPVSAAAKTIGDVGGIGRNVTDAYNLFKGGGIPAAAKKGLDVAAQPFRDLGRDASSAASLLFKGPQNKGIPQAAPATGPVNPILAESIPEGFSPEMAADLTLARKRNAIFNADPADVPFGHSSERRHPLTDKEAMTFVNSREQARQQNAFTPTATPRASEGSVAGSLSPEQQAAEFALPELQDISRKQRGTGIFKGGIEQMVDVQPQPSQPENQRQVDVAFATGPDGNVINPEQAIGAPAASQSGQAAPVEQELSRADKIRDLIAQQQQQLIAQGSEQLTPEDLLLRNDRGGSSQARDRGDAAFTATRAAAQASRAKPIQERIASLEGQLASEEAGTLERDKLASSEREKAGESATALGVAKAKTGAELTKLHTEIDGRLQEAGIKAKSAEIVAKINNSADPETKRKNTMDLLGKLNEFGNLGESLQTMKDLGFDLLGDEAPVDTPEQRDKAKFVEIYGTDNLAEVTARIKASNLSPKEQAARIRAANNSLS